MLIVSPRKADAVSFSQIPNIRGMRSIEAISFLGESGNIARSP